MLSARYVIVIDGEIDPRCATAFEPAVVKIADGVTELETGQIDQAALHSVLGRLSSLGLALLSVTSSQPRR